MRAPPTPAAGTRAGRGRWRDERGTWRDERRWFRRREPSRVEGGRARGWEQPAVGDRSTLGTGRREAEEAAAAGCGGRREEGAIGVGLGAGLSVLGVAGRSPPGRVCAEEEPLESVGENVRLVHRDCSQALHVPAKSGKLWVVFLFFSQPSFALRKRYELLSAFAELETTCHHSSLSSVWSFIPFFVD